MYPISPYDVNSIRKKRLKSSNETMTKYSTCSSSSSRCDRRTPYFFLPRPSARAAAPGSLYFWSLCASCSQSDDVSFERISRP